MSQLARWRGIAAIGLCLFVLVGSTKLLAEEPSDEDRIEVVEATVAIASGTTLTFDMVTSTEVRRSALPENALHARDLEFYVGAPVFVDRQEGQILLTADFALPERTLEDNIPDGKAALEIPAENLGIAALVAPGTIVDILVTLSGADAADILSDSDYGDSPMVTLMLVEDASVIAVGDFHSTAGLVLDVENPFCDEAETLTVAVDEERLDELETLRDRGELTILIRHLEDRIVVDRDSRSPPQID